MSKQIKSLPILLINRDLIAVFVLKIALIFLLREEEFLHRGTLGTPYVVIVLHHGCDV